MKRQKNNGKVVFKEYNMGQSFLFPPSLEDLIPDRHLVRIVNLAIERMDLRSLIRQYQGGGTSSYHPKMLLKILVYGYTQKIYSSRQIAKNLRENIHFMWLSGQNRPDFRTLNRFRASRLKNTIYDVFQSVVQILIEEGYIKLENYFLDGTTIEANANRYSYVWKKSTEKHKAKVQFKIKELIDHIERANEAENDKYQDKDLEEVEGNEISSDKMDKLVKKLNQKLKEKTEDTSSDTTDNEKDPTVKNVNKIIKQLEKEYIPRLKKYEEQEKKLAGKNSCSKTDTDAVFMRTKDDHFKSGQLKPGYNIQTGTENQFIVGYSVHQKPSDTAHLIQHLEKIEQELPILPKNLVADAGYGSEENYQYITKKTLGNFVKYNYFYREQHNFKKDRFLVDKFKYDKNKDEYICPAGKSLLFQSTERKKSVNGYISSNRVYQCQNCFECNFKTECLHSDQNRTIRINLSLNQFKEKVKENLLSDLGKKLRKLRSIEVESVFGQIKQNMNFRRFNLRGLQKVAIEWGLISIAHNLKKIPA